MKSLLSQLAAAVSALWIGCVPAAFAQGLPPGGAQVVTQAPCAFCLQFTNIQSIDHFKQTLTFSAPGRGVAVVTAHGSLACTNTVSDLAIIDLAAQIVRDNEPVDVSDGPGRLVLFAQLPGHGATTFNLASTRTFEVAAAGDFGARHDFHLRLRRSFQSPNTSCHLRDVALTIHFVRIGI